MVENSRLVRKTLGPVLKKNFSEPLRVKTPLFSGNFGLTGFLKPVKPRFRVKFFFPLKKPRFFKKRG